MHIKNNVKYISEDCEILCIPLWHEWFLDSIVPDFRGWIVKNGATLDICEYSTHSEPHRPALRATHSII